MAILKAEILTEVNQNLGRAETDIDVEIRDVLYDLSSRDNFLLNSSLAGVTTDSVAYISLPDDFKELKSIVLNDGSQDGDPLTKITWEEYLQNISGSPSDSEPEHYVIHNDLIWLEPNPDGEYTVKMYFWRYHTSAITTILFPEQFRKCINAGVTAAVAASFQLDDEAKWASKYEYQIRIRQSNLIKDPIINKYHDL